MERNIIQPLNKLPAAASHQLGCEEHSDFTGAVYLDMELFIHSAARNTTQSPGSPGAGDGVCYCTGQGWSLCLCFAPQQSAPGAQEGLQGGGRDRQQGLRVPWLPRPQHRLLWGDFATLLLPEPGSGDGLCPRDR